MSLNTTMTTVSPQTPEKQFRSTYLFSTSSPPSGASSRARSKSPSNGRFSTLDPSSVTPLSDNSVAPGSEGANGEGEWSSAVGRASVAGKSGRVIERLMGEVDRLKRELNLAQARVEEEQLRSVSARETLESLRGTKENLEAICETNSNIIARRERKIEELKAELEAERERRTNAEKGRNDLSVEMQGLKHDTANEVARASNAAAKASSEYETFKKSLQRMKAEWDKSLAQMRKELDVVQQDRDSERGRLRNLATVCEQLREEQRKSTRAYEQITQEYHKYRQLMDDSVKDMSKSIKDGDAANQELNLELERTLGKMRWVINVRQNVPSIRQNHDEEDDPNGVNELQPSIGGER